MDVLAVHRSHEVGDVGQSLLRRKVGQVLHTHVLGRVTFAVKSGRSEKLESSNTIFDISRSALLVTRFISKH